LSWPVAAFAGIALFVVRPVCGWISLIGAHGSASERRVISFFGIRGLGTFYYLSYGMGKATFPGSDIVLAAVSLTVLVSILLHGVTVTPIMRYLDRTTGRDTESAQLDLELTPPPEGALPSPDR
jgi:NhaP-type Na+/H+ or K+/H+ antiporter